MQKLRYLVICVQHQKASSEAVQSALYTQKK